MFGLFLISLTYTSYMAVKQLQGELVLVLYTAVTLHSLFYVDIQGFIKRSNMLELSKECVSQIGLVALNGS